jgi:hypothetical protein
MNRLIINDVSISHNHLKFNYSIEGAWRKCFIEEQPFIVEYSEDISDTPPSVAVIPFLCNILPIAWIFDAEIILKELDEDFYDAIEKFKDGYVQMYPKINFNGILTVKNVVRNEQVKYYNNAVVLFSGGVDSNYTLLSHIDEKPTLVTLWGADIKLDDHIGWNKVQNHIHNVASAYNLDFIIIKSSFRKFIDGGFLSDYVYPLSSFSSCYWYPNFQHGIGILGHLAPYAFAKMIKTAYIASSFNIQLKGQIPCASDPTIDNHM